MNASKLVQESNGGFATTDIFEPLMVLGHAAVLLVLKLFRRV